jgi:hypothetical protein
MPAVRTVLRFDLESGLGLSEWKKTNAVKSIQPGVLKMPASEAFFVRLKEYNSNQIVFALWM